MRKQVSLLAEFLGAAKDLTNEYADLAEITDDEKNQIGQTILARSDRKATAQLLKAKGLTTRQIASVTGWSHVTISREFQGKQKVFQMKQPKTRKLSRIRGRNR
jgi:IS30 family transposase